MDKSFNEQYAPLLKEKIIKLVWGNLNLDGVDLPIMLKGWPINTILTAVHQLEEEGRLKRDYVGLRVNYRLMGRRHKEEAPK